MGFFEIGEKDLKAIERLIWPAKEVVRFVITDFKENQQSGSLILNCRVLSGEFAGRDHTIYIENRDHPVSQKLRVQFALAFWKAEEIKAGNHNPAKLINREFEARAGAVREHDGKQYQNFESFRDIGPHGGGATAEDGAGFTDENGNPRF